MNFERAVKIYEGAKVVARSAVTLATVTAAGVTAFATEIADTWPDGARWATAAAATLLAATAALRRVAPVGKADRGVLP